MDSAHINCLRCQHYLVTWDPVAPRGCKAHGFKTREIPSELVKRTSGMSCQLFEPRLGAADDEREPPQG